jgi:hypothetical protein
MNAVTIGLTIDECLRNTVPERAQWLTNKVNSPRTV